jgi:4-amino-4-deoxy-L-arabinose transferase-like glycosyltransferase
VAVVREATTRAPVPARAGGRLRGRFPGAASVWLMAAATGALTVIIVLVWLATSHETYAGTNSVAVRSVVTSVPAGEQICVRELPIPDHTGAVRVGVFWKGAESPGFEAELVGQGGLRRAGSVPGVSARSPVSGARVDIPVRPIELDEKFVTGTLCVAPQGRAAEFGGMQELPVGQPAPTVGGRPLDARVAVWFLPPKGEARSLLSLLPELLDRAALFRPAPIGAWTYAILLLVVWPLLAYAAVRLLATRVAGRQGGFRTALAVGGICFAAAASWALLTPPFDAPDEPEHFAYSQAFAETGKAPDRSPGNRSPYSSRATLALDAVRIYSHVEAPDARPPWDAFAERAWQAAMERSPGTQDDGGGYLISTSTHAPLYYALTAPAYFLADEPFSQLTLMRLVSALLAAVAAACAFLTVRELLPRTEWAAVVAGLVVAFQPMFTFIGGALNNDNGVNALGAMTLYLMVRALRRGLTVPLGIALGACVVALPLMKGTGYALYPAVAVGVAGMLWRRRDRSDVPAYASLAATGVGLYVLWSQVADSFGRTVFTTPGGASPAGSGGIGEKVWTHFSGYLSYVWQVFLPRLPFMTELQKPSWPFYDIYIERGWAAFGWYAFKFPGWVYALITAGVVGGFLLCAVTVWRERVAATARFWELAVLVTALVGVIAGVEAAYFNTFAVDNLLEQGRYAFTAIVPLAAIAAGACFAFGRRRAPLVGSLLVCAVIALAVCSQVLGLTSFYS